MIEIPFLYGEAAFACIWSAVRIIVWIRQKRIDLKRELLLLLMFVNLAVIIRFIFYPFSRVDGKVQPLLFDPDNVYPFKLNFEPLVHIAEYDSIKDTLINIIGNTTMFIPSGIIFPIIYKKLGSFPKTAAAGALLSLCIEIIQLPFFERTSDVDDLILNSFGCMIGYGIYALCTIKHRKSEKLN